MLIKWWEYLRGYDGWTAAVTTVKSSKLSRIGISEIVNDSKSGVPLAFGWKSSCEISWKDQNLTEHSAVFEAIEESPLYQLTEGDTVSIRFNPNKPSQYYLSGLIQSQFLRILKTAVNLLMIVVITIGFIVVLLAH